MTFWMEVLLGCLGSIFAGLFFVFWYVVFQRFLAGGTDPGDRSQSR
jgi:hypothetical protein